MDIKVRALAQGLGEQNVESRNSPSCRPHLFFRTGPPSVTWRSSLICKIKQTDMFRPRANRQLLDLHEPSSLQHRPHIEAARVPQLRGKDVRFDEEFETGPPGAIVSPRHLPAGALSVNLVVLLESKVDVWCERCNFDGLNQETRVYATGAKPAVRYGSVA